MPAPNRIGAQIAHILYSANRGKGAPALKVEDFFPWMPWPDVAREQTPEEQYAAFRASTNHL